MSRFALSPGATIGSLGSLVLKLAKLTYRPSNQPFEFNSVGDLAPLQVSEETEFLPSFSNQIVGGAEYGVGDSTTPGTSGILDGTLVIFHFDRTHTDEQGNRMKIVNVVVPDLDGKYDPMEPERPCNPNLDGAAAESVGYVVYAHCSN